MNKPDKEEYASLKNDALFAVLPPRTLVEIGGDDRVSFLHNLCTNDIRNLEVGHGCEAFFTDVKGKILLHCLLFSEENSIVLSAPSGFADSILPHLDKYLIREDVTLSDRSGDWREIWFAGSEVEADMQKLGIRIPSLMLSHVDSEVCGAAARVRRVPFAAEPCFVLQLASDELDKVSSGFSALEVGRASDAIVELARIEAKFPEFGRDITGENLPQEVGRDPLAISFTKGCYLGQETVARIDALGHVNRNLVSLEFDSASELPAAGDELSVEGKVVGSVTSASWLPDLAAGSPKVAALGYVRREVAEKKTDVVTSAGVARVA